MAGKGRVPDPKRRKRSTGHRPQTGEKKTKALVLPENALAVRNPPADLPPVAAETWKVCLAEMGGNRALRESDLVLLKAYCEAVNVVAEASVAVHEFGALLRHEEVEDEIEDPDTGEPVIKILTRVTLEANPAVKVLKDATASARQLSDVLGLNPLARIRAGLMEIAGESLILGMRERLLAKLEK